MTSLQRSSHCCKRRAVNINQRRTNMKRFAEFVVRRRWWILATWLVAAILIVGLSPTLTSVESNDQSSFLPKGYESIEAINTSKKISPHSQDATDLVVFTTSSGKALTAADKQAITSATKAVA